jgi:hypothetical protein
VLGENLGVVVERLLDGSLKAPKMGSGLEEPEELERLAPKRGSGLEKPEELE